MGRSVLTAVCTSFVLAACIEPESTPAVAELPAVDEADGEVAAPARPRRVLLVIADDLGARSTPMYADDFTDVELDTARMPVIEARCGDGVRFRRAWSAPTCSPTRAAMLTGRFNFRNDTVELVGNTTSVLPVDEPTLPRLMQAWQPGTALAQFGKWNLGHSEVNGFDAAPNTMGWPHYAGFLDAAVLDHHAWPRTVDGRTAEVQTYTTTQTVDDTIAWLETLPPEQPWVAWVAFNAPHAPFHAPPSELHDYALDAADPTAAGMPDADTLRPYFHAATQAMDTELGRLLAWLDAHGQGDTDVIFIGDNGSPPEVLQSFESERHGKGTTYEGGVHVPLCAWGPSVADGGRVVDAPVGAVDVLATLLDLGGAPVDQVLASDTFDSQSLAPVLRDPAATLARDWAYTESSSSLGEYGATRAVLHQDQKLIRFVDVGDTRELYDLAADPLETTDRLQGTGWLEASTEEASHDESDRHGDDDDQGDDDCDDPPEDAEVSAATERADALAALMDTIVSP